MKIRYFTIPLLVAALAATSSGCKRFLPWELIRDAHTEIDLEYLNELNTPTPPFILTLDEAIAIALENNLDLLVKEKEFAVQHEIATREKFKMLPSLTANGEAKMRNQNTGSFSQSLTPQPPAPPSISSERYDRLADLTLAWNFLDFGLSYYRARQEKSKALMLDLDYERVGQNIVLNVVKQYWKASVSKHAMLNSKNIMDKSRALQETLENEMNLDLIPDVVGLQQEIRLISSRVQIQAYRKDYHEAKMELSLLIGFPPGVDFDVEDIKEIPPEVISLPVEELEELALRSRPELYSKDIEESAMADEVRIAMLQMIPSNALYSAYNYESNKFLIFHAWLSAGAKISWQLLNIPYRFHDVDVARIRKDWIFNQRLALALGVITQVRIAYLLYHDALEDFLLYQELYQRKARLLEATRKYAEMGEISESEVIVLEADTLISELDALKVYGALQTMLEQLNNSIGIPRYITLGSVNCDGNESENNNTDVTDIVESEDPIEFVETAWDNFN